MRQLILRFSEVKKENEELYAMVDQRDKEIVLLKDQLQQAQRDYNSLKTARMLEVTDGDVEGAKKRIAGLIREVNRCITMMSER
jgi:predicted  nucleic acid-binding Zn-ribbon protein